MICTNLTKKGAGGGGGGGGGGMLPQENLKFSVLKIQFCCIFLRVL